MNKICVDKTSQASHLSEELKFAQNSEFLKGLRAAAGLCNIS